MPVQAPPRPPRPQESRPPIDPEALFAEARRHRRRRRLRAVGIAAAVLVLAAGAYGAVRNGAADSRSGGSGAAAATPALRTVVLLVDVSGSMRADDVKPTRLAAAVTAMTGLLDRLPPQTEVGLVSFSSGANVVQPPTTDRALVRTALRSLMPQAGTALGAGLASAVASTQGSLERQGVERRPGELAPAAIVLESDGAQNRGRTMPLQAAALAAKQGIRVYGVALGKSGGTVGFGFGQLVNRIPVPPDPKTVDAIAHLTGGSSYTAGTAARLAAVYRRIGDQLAQT